MRAQLYSTVGGCWGVEVWKYYFYLFYRSDYGRSFVGEDWKYFSYLFCLRIYGRKIFVDKLWKYYFFLSLLLRIYSWKYFYFISFVWGFMAEHWWARFGNIGNLVNPNHPGWWRWQTHWKWIYGPPETRYRSSWPSFFFFLFINASSSALKKMMILVKFFFIVFLKK